ncbi:tRNA wybutosine-synthesizing protein 3 homolog [Saccoglossus kowalevskii]|uniref:tRNA wybutosine-synthesizing protein 3 homolog n=1 Tax=Saccoglossus kowalevskii TaxID=10224 RepID=A0ABM0LZ39_SACKO|nr:PREDICTED: tRNA wybutosine-synthesizing protein 3 homolog [Saccoglossus kowalevskii]
MSASIRFDRRKESCLKSVDLSKKGSIDEAIIDLVNYINQHEQYFTTSSCSGRISIFTEDSESSVRKKGCKWLYVTHGSADINGVKESVHDIEDDATLKFEPFVLHVQCRTLEDARLLHQVAIESGFRNSGMSIGKSGKIIAAVRSTHGLEVPIAAKSKLIVSVQYIEYIIKLANQKLEENMARIDRFFTNLKAHMAVTNDKSTLAAQISGKSRKKTVVCEYCHRKQSNKYEQKHFDHSNPTCKTPRNVDSPQNNSDLDPEDIAGLFDT